MGTTQELRKLEQIVSDLKQIQSSPVAVGIEGVEPCLSEDGKYVTMAVMKMWASIEFRDGTKVRSFGITFEPPDGQELVVAIPVSRDDQNLDLPDGMLSLRSLQDVLTNLAMVNENVSKTVADESVSKE
jgi:hypothetical protein